MARIVRIHQHGGPEVLRMEQIDVPSPGPAEVQIRVKALGLNRAEALLRRGTYIETPNFPTGLGLEAAGTIESLGDKVNGLMPGDAVSVIPPMSMTRWPTYGDLINYPAEYAVKHPPSLTFSEAASVWMAYLTAYGALVDIAKLQRCENIVITAASSSVGIAAIQIANLIGAKPIAVTRTSKKRTALHQMGAAYVIASEEEDLERRLLEISASQGIRVVFDAVGGPIFEPLTSSMSDQGVLIEYGGLSREPTPFPILSVLSKSLTLRGYLVHEVLKDRARLRAAIEYILEGLENGSMRPIVAKTFDFDQIIQAHQFLESNEQIGKIVVRL